MTQYLTIIAGVFVFLAAIPYALIPFAKEDERDPLIDAAFLLVLGAISFVFMAAGSAWMETR